jgi:hypothetical protein
MCRWRSGVDAHVDAGGDFKITKMDFMSKMRNALFMIYTAMHVHLSKIWRFWSHKINRAGLQKSIILEACGTTQLKGEDMSWWYGINEQNGTGPGRLGKTYP